MNEYKLQNAKRKEQVADKLVCSVLKRMGWSVRMPLQIRSLIISFLYRSFFGHPAMYTLVSSFNKLGMEQQSHWLDEGCEYIVQTASQKISFKVSCWTAIQGDTLDYARLFISFVAPIQDHFQCQRMKFECNQQDLANILSVFRFLKKYRNRIFAVPSILRKIMNKNIILLKSEDFVYCIIGRIVILSFFKNKVGLLYNHQQKRWKLSNNVLLWKKGVTPNRKRHWICYNKHQIFEIQGPFIHRLEYFPFNEQPQISYQIK